MSHPAYIIKRSVNDQFYFVLTAANGEPILKSETYTTKDNCKNGIQSCRENSPVDSRYERKRTSSGSQYFFNLKAANYQVIGTSEMYNSASAMETGIDSVNKNGPVAPVDDQS